MATKSTIWPIYVVGAVCLAISGALLAMFVVVDGRFGGSAGEYVALAIPYAAGLAAFRAGAEERARQRAGTAEPERRARRNRRSTTAPIGAIGPAPRLGDDPFRDPPAAPPIVVVRHAAAPVAPIVPGGHGESAPVYLGPASRE